MGDLSYADDITIMCPCIGGLNKMLKICYNFAQSNRIIFNNKKTVCTKFGRGCEAILVICNFNKLI